MKRVDKPKTAQGVLLSDCYGTPKWLTDLLPLVDFDPCSGPRSTVKARKHYSLERGLNGLKLPWHGSGFTNFPYSCPLDWISKFNEERRAKCCTEMLTLCKLDTSTEWWRTTLTNGGEFARPRQWQFHSRIQYDEPPELIAWRVEQARLKGKETDGSSSNNFCSVLLHWWAGEAPKLQLDLSSVADLWV